MYLNELWRWGHEANFFKQQTLFKKAKVGYTPRFTFSDTETSVGIEVEVEHIDSHNGVGVDDTKSFNLWRNVEDGSLRNGGREFVSIPVAGSNIEFALDMLHLTLTKSKTCLKHEFTDRTSVHIHVDFREATSEQLATLLLTYIAVEPLLYKMAGGDRDVNIFTVPVQDTILYDGLLRDVFTHLDNPTAVDALVRYWLKYTGINLAPLRSYGTVEFRHMHGNMNVLLLCNWIDTLLQLKTFAMTNKFADVLKTVTELNTTSEYMAFLQSIFRKNPTVLEYPNLNADQELETTTAKIKKIMVPPRKKEKNLIDFSGSVFEKHGFVSVHQKPAPQRDINVLNDAAFRVDWANIGQTANQEVPNTVLPATVGILFPTDI